MRLREFAGGDTRTQAGTLMTVIQHFIASEGENAEIPFSMIQSAMNNSGYNFSYPIFVDLYNSTPSVQNMIGTHDEETITLGKKQNPQPGAKEPEDVVGDMASGAAEKLIK